MSGCPVDLSAPGMGVIERQLYELAYLYSQERLGTIEDSDRHLKQKGKLLKMLDRQLEIATIEHAAETCEMCDGTGEVSNGGHPNDPSSAKRCPECELWYERLDFLTKP